MKARNRWTIAAVALLLMGIAAMPAPAATAEPTVWLKVDIKDGTRDTIKVTVPL